MNWNDLNMVLSESYASIQAHNPADKRILKAIYLKQMKA